MQWWIKLCFFSLPPTSKGYCQCYNHVIFKTADPKVEGERQSHLLGHTEDGFFPFLHWNFNIILHMLHRQQSSLKKQEEEILNFLPGEIPFIVTTNQLQLLSSSTRCLNWLLQVRMPRETKKINAQSHMQEVSSWQSLQLQIDNVQHTVICSELSKCQLQYILLPKGMVKISPVPQYMRRM